MKWWAWWSVSEEKLAGVEAVVTFAGASYSINGRLLVGPLDFTVSRGETVVFLGESGSGKTTTLRLINGLIHPTEGTVSVNGRQTSAWDGVQLRRNIGYVIQESGLLPHLTVNKNVGLVPKLKGWTPPEITRRVKEMLELVGLSPGDFGDRHPHQLSGGQRQRVGVARALAADPPLLLCDEPFGALDPATRRALQREFKDLAHRLDKTVVFVTHDVREALFLGDRVIVLEAGCVRFTGSPQEFSTSDVPAVQVMRDDSWTS